MKVKSKIIGYRRACQSNWNVFPVKQTVYEDIMKEFGSLKEFFNRSIFEDFETLAVDTYDREFPQEVK